MMQPAETAENVGAPAPRPIPHELCKAVLPTYVIEPPDILVIDAVHVVPKPPYHLRAMDAISLQVQGVPADMPISGVYPIEPGGLLLRRFLLATAIRRPSSRSQGSTW